MEWADPSESESSTQLNSNSGSRLTTDLVEFPPLGPEDLVRLGEDLLHICPIYNKVRYHSQEDDEHLSSISNVISRGMISPMGLSSEEATALAERFRKVPLPRQICSQCLTHLVIRSYPDILTRVSVQTRGPDF